MSARAYFAGFTILVIEDHDDSRAALRQMLELLDITVAQARDGKEALAILSTTRPDAVLCDLRMPGIDGFAFMERIRSTPEWSRLRVVAMSGLTSPGDLLRTWAAGFDAHLEKPIDYDAVVATLERILCRRPPRPISPS